MRLLVTGATGSVSGRLVPVLVSHGHDVRAQVRDAANYDAPDGVDVAEGDLLELGSFEAALEDINAAYYLVHSTCAGEDFEERNDLSTHLQSPRKVERILAGGDYPLRMLRAASAIRARSDSFEMVRYNKETPFDAAARRGLARGRDA